MLHLMAFQALAILVCCGDWYSLIMFCMMSSST